MDETSLRGCLNQFIHTMSTKILRTEGRFEIIGVFQNGVQVKIIKRLITRWK